MKLNETDLQNESTLHSLINYFVEHDSLGEIAKNIQKAAEPLFAAAEQARTNPRCVVSLKVFWECEIEGRICNEGYVYRVRYFCNGVQKVESGPVEMLIRDSDLYSDLQDAVCDIAFGFDLRIGNDEVTVSKDDLCAVWAL